MSKIKIGQFLNSEGVKIRKDQYLYFCPGCKHEHAFSLREEGGEHNFDGSLNYPTVAPSVLFNFTPGHTCHHFIQSGKISFLSDCDHDLKGQTVELPDIE